MFGFLQKHHNSQLQNETSATAVSVVLVECHKMNLCFIEHRKTSKSISSTDDIRPNQNYKLRSVHSQSFHVEIGSSTDRHLVKSKLCNVTDLSALYQVGFSHPLSMRGQYGVFVQYVVQSMQCNAIQKVMASHHNPEKSSPLTYLQ